MHYDGPWALKEQGEITIGFWELGGDGQQEGTTEWAGVLSGFDDPRD